MATTRERVGRGRRDKPRTAERLLGEVGAEAMTVETIAAGAGLSRGSLYFYFGSKNEVLAALVARTMQFLDASARTAGDDVERPPAEVVRQAMKDTERQWIEHGLLMRAAVELAPTVPDIKQLWEETIALYVASFTKVLRRAGLPDGKGPRSAAAMAEVLCWGTERNLYRASTPPVDAAAVRRASARSLELWLAVIERGGR
jgi:TetR/AcrR family transcriptional regulator, ethionamide resistance regulator